MQRQEIRPRLSAQVNQLNRLSEAIQRLMDEKRVSKSELASRLGVRASNVTSLLAPGKNLEVRTVDRVLAALDCSAWDLANALDYVNGRGAHSPELKAQAEEIAEGVGVEVSPSDRETVARLIDRAMTLAEKLLDKKQ